MPKKNTKKNTKMFSNREALVEGIQRALWKIELGKKYFNEIVNYKIKDVAFFDHREAPTVAALLIDISSVADKPEDVKRKFYLDELEKFEQEFVLSNDAETKHSFMEKLCGALATSIDIDWNDEAAIDHIICSLKAQQTPGTTAEKVPFEIFSAYTTMEGVQRLEGISIRNLSQIQKCANALAAKHRDLGKMISHTDAEYPGYRLRMDIAEIIQEGIDNGTNVISFDPTASRIMKDYFLDNEFDIVTEKPSPFEDDDQIETTHYTEENVMQDFMEGIYEVSKCCINEQRLVGGYLQKGKRSDLLSIDGKTMTEIINEKKTELGGDSHAASVAARQFLRDALRDGKSVVSLMRANVLAGGKVVFTHQEIKVDLDKLNKLERKEKHNAFRRALDFFKIYRIKPKYPSNAQREANQKRVKESQKYQDWKKGAEKKFIDTYNEASKEKRASEEELIKKGKEGVSRDTMFQAFPEVSNAENENELENIDQSINNNNRERLPSISFDLVDDKKIDSSEPVVHEELNKSKSADVTIK